MRLRGGEQERKEKEKQNFRFHDTVNYAHLHSKCTLQYFNKSTFNNFYLLQTGCVPNLELWGINTQYLRYSEVYQMEY
jgi:hypothetical protein